MTDPQVHVVCLCAAWCRLCDDYAPVLEAVCAEFAAAGVRLQRHWIDIEDEADLVGDFDVETFPTLVVLAADGVRFAGALMPQPENLRRLLRATVVDAAVGTRWPDVAPEILAFAARFRAGLAPA